MDKATENKSTTDWRRFAHRTDLWHDPDVVNKRHLETMLSMIAIYAVNNGIADGIAVEFTTTSGPVLLKDCFDGEIPKTSEASGAA